MATLHELWGETETQLQPFWPHSARRDARLILMMALSLSASEFYRDTQCSITDPEKHATLQQLVARRIQGEPIQYLRGEQEFYGLPMYVGPGSLIPRPETEILLEQVLLHIPVGLPLRAADLGCGSGALAVALAVERPHLSVEAIDISTEALAWTKRNIARHHVENQVVAKHGDMIRSLQGSYDVIVSNPPYIPSGTLATLASDVLREPKLALDGGPDGLDFYRAIADRALKHLAPRGWLMLEVGDNQADPVHAIFCFAFVDQRFEVLSQYKVVDYAGMPRVLVYQASAQQ